jgi:hypothetical protein
MHGETMIFEDVGGDFTLVEVIFIILFVDLCTYVCVHKFLRMACNFVMYSLNCWYTTMYI